MVIKANSKSEWIRVYAETLARNQNVLPKEKHFEVAKREWELLPKKVKK